MIITKNETRALIVKKIKDLKKRKATFQEISDEFNNINYKTTTGGKWTPQAVYRFLKTHSKK